MLMTEVVAWHFSGESLLISIFLTSLPISLMSRFFILTTHPGD